MEYQRSRGGRHNLCIYQCVFRIDGVRNPSQGRKIGLSRSARAHTVDWGEKADFFYSHLSLTVGWRDGDRYAVPIHSLWGEALQVRRSACIALPVCLSVSGGGCVCMYGQRCVSVSLCVCVSVCLSVCLSVCISVSVCICLGSLALFSPRPQGHEKSAYSHRGPGVSFPASHLGGLLLSNVVVSLIHLAGGITVRKVISRQPWSS